MESRLPKPKITTKKTNETMDLNSNKPTAKSGESSASSKVTNENKLFVKPSLVRSKTFTSLAQTSTSKPIKRTATTVTSVGEAKRPFVKPKALANRPNTQTSGTTNKGTQNDGVQKIQKWDLRGRLAQASDKLSHAQQKNKDIETKYKELQELSNTLKASELACRTKAEQLEASNNTLNSELDSLKAEMSAMRQRQADLSRHLKESEEARANVSHALQELQTKHTAQEASLSEQNEQLKVLKANLSSQKTINEDLNIVKNELQSLTHSMDKERRLLHNTIQELKGNIRVFCRVRPRTPKEIELMKT